MPNGTYWGAGTKDRGPTRCTIAGAHGAFCDLPVPDGSPISACAQHLRAAYAFCRDLIERASVNQLAGLNIEDAPLSVAESLRDRIRAERTVVYYARIGTQIKIGRTVHLAARMKALGANELLATEPGDFDLETQRHREFAHLKIDDGRKDYFRPGPDLLAHIAALVERHTVAEAA